MRYLMALVVALISSVACSDSPTAPTPVADAPRLANLRWDVSAPGCTPPPPPSPLPNPAEARLEPGPHGAIFAMWPYDLPSGRRVTLHARLLERDAQLLVCEWDLADL